MPFSLLILTVMSGLNCLTVAQTPTDTTSTLATTSLASNVWPTSISKYPLLAARYNWNILPSDKIKSVANLTLASSSELEFQDEFYSAEETTPRSSRQVGTSILRRNNNLNPALNPLYNTYNPLSGSIDTINSNFDPLNTNYNPSTNPTFSTRADDGLDAFTARRASIFSVGVDTKIRFQDTVTQVPEQECEVIWTDSMYSNTLNSGGE